MTQIADIVEDLRSMTVELEKLGAFDQHASTILRLTRATHQLAQQLQRLEAEGAGVRALQTLLDSQASASRPGKAKG